MQGLHSEINQTIAATPSSRLSIIILTFLLAASSMVTVTDTPSFPEMTCKGGGGGTCPPGNAPFFDFGPIDETKCHSGNIDLRWWELFKNFWDDGV